MESKRLNILVAAHMLSIPQTNGYSIRVYSLYSRLAKRHNLTWVLPWDYGSLNDPLYRNVLLGKPRHNLHSRLIALLKRLPQKAFWFQVASSYLLHPVFFARPGMYYVPEIAWFTGDLRELATSGKFDLLMVEHEILGEHIPGNLPIPTMLIMQNLPTVVFERTVNVMDETQSRTSLVNVQRERIQKHQNNMLMRADEVVFMSEDDERLAKQSLPNIRSFVVPNGVDINYFRPRPEVPLNPRRLVFIGTLSYFPNVDAVKYLCEVILPHVKKAGLEVEITIIGSGQAPEELNQLTKSVDVYWAGAVDDVRPDLASAAAFIVPLRVGSGTRLKVLTAMAMGTPVISTRIGSEGINAVDGENILLADSPEEFADAIRKVLTMPELRERLSKAGRKLMEQQYSWDSIAPRLEAECVKLVETARISGSRNG